MPCGTKPVLSAVAGSDAHAPPSEPIGTRLIDSTPPARISSSKPPRTRDAAWLTASSPEAQKRLSWTPAVVSGSPAASAAVLAMSPPWSPTGDTTPSTTSSMRLVSRVGLRLPQLVDQADHQVDRLHLVERARGLALATRGAEVVVHECFCHGIRL